MSFGIGLMYGFVNMSIFVAESCEGWVQVECGVINA